MDGKWSGDAPTCARRLYFDTSSGLEWQIGYSAGVTQPDAVTYCENLSVLGRNDFRLPSARELTTLLRYELPSGNGYSIGVASELPSVMARWSITTMGSRAWQLTGVSDARLVGAEQLTIAQATCVRGAALASPSLTDNGDGTVRDARTGLTWQKADDGTLRAKTVAASYCSSLSLAGTGWRLPTAAEMIDLIDFEALGTGRRSPLGGSTGSYFWTTTQGSYASSVAVEDAIWYWSSPDDNSAQYVRCVR